MGEDFNPTIESSGFNQSNERNEWPSEAEISRVEAQAQKAKQMAGISAQNKQQNAMIAKFLTILMQSIKDDNLLTQFHRTFFRLTDKNGQTRIRKSTNNTVMIGVFVPFFQNEIDQCGLTNIFSPFYEYGTNPTLESYISYLKKVFFHHLEKIPVDKEQLMILIMAIISYFKLNTPEAIREQWQENFKNSLNQKLFQNTNDSNENIHIPNSPEHHGKHGHHHTNYPEPRNAA